MLTIHVEALTLTELIRETRAALGLAEVKENIQDAWASPGIIEEAAPTEVPSIPDPPAPVEKKSRKKKAEIPTRAKIPTEELSDSLYTFENMKEAIKKVSVLRADDVGMAGIVRARNILAKYGFKRIKEVTQDHYKQVIEDCEKDLAG